MSNVAHPDPYGLSGIVNAADVFYAPEYDVNGSLVAVEGYALTWYIQRDEQTVGRTVVDEKGELHTHSLTHTLTHSLTHTPSLSLFYSIQFNTRTH